MKRIMCGMPWSHRLSIILENRDQLCYTSNIENGALWVVNIIIKYRNGWYLPFFEAHKARSWNNLNLIWFWFSGNQLNAPDLEMGGPPLGHGEKNNVSHDDIVTVAGASSATPPVLQEVLASGVQALEIASQLTISGWQQLTLLCTIHGKNGERGKKDFLSLAVIIDQYTTIMYSSWV